MAPSAPIAGVEVTGAVPGYFHFSIPVERMA